MYKIRLTKIAIENLNRIEIKTRTQIINKIDLLKEDPELRGKQLKGVLKELALPAIVWQLGQDQARLSGKEWRF